MCRTQSRTFCSAFYTLLSKQPITYHLHKSRPNIFASPTSINTPRIRTVSISVRSTPSALTPAPVPSTTQCPPLSPVAYFPVPNRPQPGVTPHNVSQGSGTPFPVHSQSPSSTLGQLQSGYLAGFRNSYLANRAVWPRSKHARVSAGKIRDISPPNATRSRRFLVSYGDPEGVSRTVSSISTAISVFGRVHLFANHSADRRRSGHIGMYDPVLFRSTIPTSASAAFHRRMMRFPFWDGRLYRSLNGQIESFPTV